MRAVGAIELYENEGGALSAVRWGHQCGSVYLLDQKLPITYPRVRDLPGNREVLLRTYQRLQHSRQADRGVLLKVLRDLSCRAYAECAEAVPAAFCVSPSTISRRFIRASVRRLRELCERRLERYDVIALVVDGKTFADDAMVIALGITLTGQKVILGFVQTATGGAVASERESDLRSHGGISQTPPSVGARDHLALECTIPELKVRKYHRILDRFSVSFGVIGCADRSQDMNVGRLQKILVIALRLQ